MTCARDRGYDRTVTIRASVLGLVCTVLGACNATHERADDGGLDAALVGSDADVVDAHVEAPDASDAGAHDPEVVAWFEAARREVCRREIECSNRAAPGEARHAACHPRSDLGADWPYWPRGTLDDVSAGRVRFDPERATACLDLLRGGSGCVYLGTDTAHTLTPCVEALLPASEIGEPCDPRAPSCTRGLRCHDSRCEPGLGEGEPCTFFDCGEGLFCDEQCTPIECLVAEDCGEGRDCDFYYRCQDEYAQIGERCGNLRECAEGLACNGLCNVAGDLGERCPCREGLACRDSVCGPLGEAGERCTHSLDCAPSAPYCADESCSADPVGRECIEVVWGMRSFDLWVDVPIEPCPAGLSCVLDSASAGRCEPAVGLGDACASDNVCPMASRCADGDCVRIVMPDAPCGPEALCPHSHECHAGVCVARPGMGDDCSDAVPCFEGACVAGACAWLGPGEPCTPGAHVCTPRRRCPASGTCPSA